MGLFSRSKKNRQKKMSKECDSSCCPDDGLDRSDFDNPTKEPNLPNFQAGRGDDGEHSPNSKSPEYMELHASSSFICLIPRKRISILKLDDIDEDLYKLERSSWHQSMANYLRRSDRSSNVDMFFEVEGRRPRRKERRDEFVYMESRGTSPPDFELGYEVGAPSRGKVCCNCPTTPRMSPSVDKIQLTTLHPIKEEEYTNEEEEEEHLTHSDQTSAKYTSPGVRVYVEPTESPSAVALLKPVLTATTSESDFAPTRHSVGSKTIRPSYGLEAHRPSNQSSVIYEEAERDVSVDGKSGGGSGPSTPSQCGCAQCDQCCYDGCNPELCNPFMPCQEQSCGTACAQPPPIDAQYTPAWPQPVQVCAQCTSAYPQPAQGYAQYASAYSPPVQAFAACSYPTVPCAQPDIPMAQTEGSKRPKSRELRGSVLMLGCGCAKANGLQDVCPRTGCQGSPRCTAKMEPCCENKQFSSARHLDEKWDGSIRKEDGSKICYCSTYKSAYGPKKRCGPFCCNNTTDKPDGIAEALKERRSQTIADLRTKRFTPASGCLPGYASPKREQRKRVKRELFVHVQSPRKPLVPPPNTPCKSTTHTLPPRDPLTLHDAFPSAPFFQVTAIDSQTSQSYQSSASVQTICSLSPSSPSYAIQTHTSDAKAVQTEEEEESESSEQRTDL